MNKKATHLMILLSIISLATLLSGCAVPSGGCPFCGYPPGVRVDGDVVHCPRCGGQYRVFLDGSVTVEKQPTQQYMYPVPTNNTDATQRSLQQNGLFLMQGLSK